MTPQLLTEEELGIIRERETHLGAYPQVVAKLLRAYEALVQQVALIPALKAETAAALERETLALQQVAELEGKHQGEHWASECKNPEACPTALRAALALERAAREAAEATLLACNETRRNELAVKRAAESEAATLRAKLEASEEELRLVWECARKLGVSTDAKGAPREQEADLRAKLEEAEKKLEKTAKLLAHYSIAKLCEVPPGWKPPV